MKLECAIPLKNKIFVKHDSLNIVKSKNRKFIQETKLG